MITYIAEKYQHALFLSEEPIRPPTEAEVQAIWFESLISPELVSDTGTRLTLIQPGIWNRTAGPDFLHAAVRDVDGRTLSGAVEIHLRAADWEAHGHHQDERYEETLLHGVWCRPTAPYFPSTKAFRRIPQVILSEHLLAPWSELFRIVEPISNIGRPLAQPGLCQRELSRASLERVLDILRSAGAWRLQRKAERLRLRQRIRGRLQNLWESLAEALGYAQNKTNLRLLAQRVPVGWPELKNRDTRTALLYGVAGFLPTEVHSGHSDQARACMRPLWDIWWKERDRLSYALLPRRVWNLSGIRPNNRPERRIAALATLYPYLSKLDKAVRTANVGVFTDILSSLKDPFWTHHTTWRSNPSPFPLQLIGQERIEDICLNIFWPLVSVEQERVAYQAICGMRSSPNHFTRIARERVLGNLAIGQALREALVQQGLLQLYQDFCLTDSTACQRCPFPELVRKF